MNETERCVRIAESQVVGAPGDDRIDQIVLAMRVHGSHALSEDANYIRCLTIARSQIHGDNADERIHLIIAAITDRRG